MRGLSYFAYLGNTRVPLTGGSYKIELQLTRCPSGKHASWSSATIYALKTLAGENVGHHLKRVKNTSSYSLVFDSISFRSSYYGLQIYRINWPATDLVDFCHLGLTNVGFADGSVRSLNPSGLIASERENSPTNGVVCYTDPKYFYLP